MQLLYLKPQQLELDPHGVREDTGDIDGLADTIREQGLLQPLGVVAAGHERYRVVYGGRRLRALTRLQVERIPCILLTGDTHDLLLQQLIENVQRQDLNDLEKANAFKRLRDRLVEQAKQEDRPIGEGELDAQIGTAVGLAPRTIRRYLGLLDLPLEVQELIRNGELTVTQAQHLRRISTPKTQIELAQMIADEGLSAGEVSNLANYFAANPSLTVDTAMQALANNLDLRTAPPPSVTEVDDPLIIASIVPQPRVDEAFWANEEERSAGDILDAMDDNFAQPRARVTRIRSLDQMVDEADRLARAYHEGDLQRWVQKDDNAAFKLRLLLKQLRSLTQALEALVGNTVDIE
jgi:ParB family chromosome partitioning protein